MQNLENLYVFEILITQKLLKCAKDPFVRSALNYRACIYEDLHWIFKCESYSMFQSRQRSDKISEKCISFERYEYF